MQKLPLSKIPVYTLKFILLIYLLFPMVLSLYVQILHISETWNFLQLAIFSVLTLLLLAPVFFIFFQKDCSLQIEKLQPYLICWILGLALLTRIILMQLISTNFTSDFADVHAVALDIYAGNPLANLANYPNIPNSLHLNMPAIVLAQVHKVFGPSTKIVKIFMVTLDTLTTFLIYQTGKTIARAKVGAWAAFLYALLPSANVYVGTLAGEYLAFPFMLLASTIYIHLHNTSKGYLYNLLGFTLLGIATGIMDWFRPLGMVLLIAFIIANLLKINSPHDLLTITSLSLVLFITYSLTTQLAVNISERVFETTIRGTSQRVGEYFIKGLNPDSGGKITIEDHNTVYKTYNEFGEDLAGAQKYLIQLALSRLDGKTFINLAKEKFSLIWSDHDALFDYALLGSNDHEFVDLLRKIETLLWIVVTLFLICNAYVSIRQTPSSGVFSIQLFILGFAILFLFMEVQNRYIAITIPYLILLSATGMDQFFLMLSQNFRKRQ